MGLQQLGIDTAFIGKIGGDPFGHFLIKALSDNGVGASLMLYRENARTGIAFVSLKADGARDFMIYRNPISDMLLAPMKLMKKQ
ncbi:MAG: fructokinase [Gammaproteobacteria bacterium]